MVDNVDDLLGEAPTLGMGERGRPPLFKTPAELQAKIDLYFKSLEPVQKMNAWGEPEWCWPQVRDEETGEVLMKSTTDADGRDIKVPVVEKRPVMTPHGIPTVAGLALFLGFSDYQSIYDNRDRSPDFSCTVKNAITRIADFAQHQLINGNTTGAIFWLKNHGWADKVKTELYGKDGGAIETKDVTEKDRKALRHFVKQYGDRTT